MDRKEEYQDERWKERASQIRDLDNHKCAMCGAKNVVLHVHHLSYPPPPFHLWDATDDELVTLCKDCHERVHKMVARPRLTENREIHTNRCEKGDCYRCLFHEQPYFVVGSDELTFEIRGGCEELGGKGCQFKEAITCENCCYADGEKCKSDQRSVACQNYFEKHCLICKHFSVNAHDFGGWCNQVCDYVDGSDGRCDDMRCNGYRYECVVPNAIMMKEYLKQYD